MHTKSFSGVKVEDAAQGRVTAVFATMGVVDSDHDVTREGAFEDGRKVAISAYGHTSWGGALPVGKGVVKVRGKKAILDGQFFMDTAAGRETFSVVKALAEDGLGEWSYGFDINEYSFGEFDGRRVRFLDRVTVHEVSPVLLGAGVGTGTLSAKSRHGEPDRPGPAVPAVRKAIPPHDTPTTPRPWDGPRTIAAITEDARPSELRSVHAWVDPDGDPEAKSSYRYPHHHGVDGPANLRAAVIHIAHLNSAACDLPEEDRKAVYEHLAEHLRAADRQPPELRARGERPAKGLRLVDEAADVLSALSALTDRAVEVVTLRATHGKRLGAGPADLLSWIGDDLKRLDRVLAGQPDDDAQEPDDAELASLLAASVARIHDIHDPNGERA
ncbi:hypothetical protein GCM10027160_29040 [Streptomyces calidiresistens]|uniref:Uncharacterized protein n=1 Tax=Streptomyces calidiresistens TaxID=1485586 RepID=A0A7W3T084_9ACTN|nr:hypothetical protein [Streptomyces calidiresistens]MBB0228522.1 hypothetical protein [Streptomyces calidiresistens]